MVVERAKRNVTTHCGRKSRQYPPKISTCTVRTDINAEVLTKQTTKGTKRPLGKKLSTRRRLAARHDPRFIGGGCQGCQSAHSLGLLAVSTN